MPPSPTFAALLSDFARSLTANFSSSVAAQPEDQLKAPVKALLEATLARPVVARSEAQVAGLGGRPDFGVAVDGLLAGYAELKAPGLGARPQRFSNERNKKQWGKFKTLPNLIYTDGNEWTLLRLGQQILHVRFSGDVTTDGERAFTDAEAEALERLIQDFLLWEPTAPSSPKALAELLAPLCRMIRDDVAVALQNPDSALSQLARDWRETLFPDADDARFADAYAQTLTYALLLARFSGAENVRPERAAETLETGHGLLAQTLLILSDREARRDVGVGLDVLIRAVNAVDPAALSKEGDDPWLYFYEDFLAAYDRKLRNDYGVYYTPAPVIQAQVRLVAELLETCFDKPLAYAEDEVVVLDPAAGTGAYPLAVLQHALEKAAEFYGPGMRSQYATQVAQNLHALEFLVGPYAVAHLRVTQKVMEEGGELPADGVHVYLADTLESPEARDLEQHGLMYRRLTEEHRRAREVKQNTRVLVCIGNPPYDRQERSEADIARGVELKGGWVRFGQQNLNDQTNGILKDFVKPAQDAGAGRHLRNLYNDYVYFWRWALWKVFEQSQDAGIISFITAASYLRGPGFVGMREHMRRTFDELWILDLEGDSLGARKTQNVFNIQTPVAIAVGVRYGKPKPDEPAKVYYAKLGGTREGKLEQLSQIKSINDVTWQSCLSEWQAPFLPEGAGDYYAWPLLTDIFPWQHTGSGYYRTWPISETKDVLQNRWKKLVSSQLEQQVKLFSETRDRKIIKEYKSLDGLTRLPALSTLKQDAEPSLISRYGCRSFDRQWAIADNRVGDFPKPVLWQSLSEKQVYMTSMFTKVLGLGSAATVSAYVPDKDYFCGRGGKDVIPLWRDAAASEPNVTAGLLTKLAEVYGAAVSPEDLFAYAYGLLASPSYVETFSEELVLPGPRLPVTKDAALFRKVSALGRSLIGLHTYGERFSGRIPRGEARNTVAVPNAPEAYPNRFSYDPESKTLHVGAGAFAPVSPEVWGFSVSGLSVVKSWLGYRMRERAGRSSSELDKVRPERWTAELTRELLELLWVLEATVAAQPELSKKLAAVVSGEVFTAADFPVPTEAERKAPEVRQVGAQTGLFGDL